MNSTLSEWQMVIRLAAAVGAGLLLGLEREGRGRAAGLRTTLLTCVTAAMAMILSNFLFFESSSHADGNWFPDPARLAQGVLTGIGFLGAGTILRQGDSIRGVTTAATLWFSTVLGLTFGAGEFDLGGIGTGIALAILFLLPRLEKHVCSDRYCVLTITTEMGALPERQLEDHLKSNGLTILRMHLDYNVAARQRTVSCELKLQRQNAVAISERILADLLGRPGVLQVKWS